MNLKEAKADAKVKFLKSVFKGGQNSTACSLAVAALRYHHILKNYPKASVKPVLRWYLGQLAREYIRKVYKNARSDLENLAEIGLIEVSEENGNALKEFHLNESLYPALKTALESVLGKEFVSKVIDGAKYYKGMNAEQGEGNINSEVVKSE
ncbi:MAG: hypothetical protein PVH61_35450 [Candidatus Aminicenantes bacterium]|jgi:hypothetical protein